MDRGEQRFNSLLQRKANYSVLHTPEAAMEMHDAVG